MRDHITLSLFNEFIHRTFGRNPLDRVRLNSAAKRNWDLVRSGSICSIAVSAENRTQSNLIRGLMSSISERLIKLLQCRLPFEEHMKNSCQISVRANT